MHTGAIHTGALIRTGAVQRWCDTHWCTDTHWFDTRWCDTNWWTDIHWYTDTHYWCDMYLLVQHWYIDANPDKSFCLPGKVAGVRPIWPLTWCNYIFKWQAGQQSATGKWKREVWLEVAYNVCPIYPIFYSCQKDWEMNVIRFNVTLKQSRVLCRKSSPQIAFSLIMRLWSVT